MRGQPFSNGSLAPLPRGPLGLEEREKDVFGGPGAEGAWLPPKAPEEANGVLPIRWITDGPTEA